MIIPLPQTGQGCPTNESGVLFGEETGIATGDGDTSVFASFDSCCGIDSEKDSNAIVSYVEYQL